MKQAARSNKKRRTIIIAVSVLTFLSLLVVFALAIFFKPAPTVVTLDGTGVSEPMYAYYLATYKQSFLNAHKDDGLRNDTASWQSMSDDGERTWKERFDGEFREKMSRKVAAAAIFDESYSLNDAAKLVIEDKIDEIIAYSGGKGAVKEVLARYGCTLADLRRAVTLDYKVSMLYSMLYGQDGSGLPQGLLEREYQARSARIKTVFIRTKGKLQSDGSHATLDEETLLTAEANIAALREHLADGMDEDEFLFWQGQFNEDESAKDYPNGYYLWSDSVYDEAVITLALSLPVGEAGIAEGDYGVYLVYRYESPVGAYAEDDNAAWFKGFVSAVTEDEFNRTVDKRIGEVVWDEAVTGKYSILDIDNNWEVVY